MNQYLAKLTDKLLICKSKLNQSNQFVTKHIEEKWVVRRDNETYHDGV